MSKPRISREAVFSPCRNYRHSLTRSWSFDERPWVAFVMLNPSVADADRDDPTVRRCIGFAREWGCGGLCVVNLFTRVTTDWHRLLWMPAGDAIGHDADRLILEAARRCERVVAAWGTHGHLHGRDAQVIDLLRHCRKAVECLGVTAGDHPKHPLYLPAGTPLVPFAPARLAAAGEGRVRDA